MELVLNLFKPEACFEWGAGHSTEIMRGHPAVKTVDSIESDKDYLELVKRKFKVIGVNFQCEEDTRYYPVVRGDHAPYGFIFVDGRMRYDCLIHAHEILEPSGVVILHDAEREIYKDAVHTFEHRFFTDNGNTGVLTNANDTAAKIGRLLSSDTV